uniref:Uncharacterized protein n=1 Tax=Anguilla anguilla TaxID=7936 RepID=A0A0E9SAN4_ANGAN
MDISMKSTRLPMPQKPTVQELQEQA